MPNNSMFSEAEWNLLTWMATEAHPQGQMNAVLGLMGNTVNPRDLGGLPVNANQMGINPIPANEVPPPDDLLLPTNNIPVLNEPPNDHLPADGGEAPLMDDAEWDKWLHDEGLDELFTQMEGNPADGQSEVSGISIIAQAGSPAGGVGTTDGNPINITPQESVPLDGPIRSSQQTLSPITLARYARAEEIAKYGVIRAIKCKNCSSVKGKCPDCIQFKRFSPCLRCTRMGRTCNLIYEKGEEEPVVEIRRNPKRKARGDPRSPDIQYLGMAQSSFTMDPGPSTIPVPMNPMPGTSLSGYVPPFPTYRALSVMQMSEHLAFLHQWNQAATAHEDHARLTRWQMIAQVQNMIDDAKRDKEDEEDDDE
ncbi:hypothetical protein TREMEDRAFT_63449 [Tremella mesenterica DSM 1558]|uniref:uncharacterized protein n=1 Tax=Tremella mesenterica (strain ATCC 24925 / CBS 8224 / DSM 1558 / NBRC 9311 / NRRL Y-6157 / RJB 2259-6 / UBC 559-6) TaxID=578456 RepID=UPI0003F4A2ED|nr:uncharacterized protein TREMEDRAFT_63449 [Tremella mesenterica DSM 1558]EIW68277.1 hypothetical protein TREMEDRAFT_63449 [Tremella mesenterica DSM 1558]